MELYETELQTLSRLLGYVEDVSNHEGVFEVEIWVRLDDVDTFAVLGWGESGDPCVLRFEPKKKPAPVYRNPSPGIITTINKNQPFGPEDGKTYA